MIINIVVTIVAFLMAYFFVGSEFALMQTRTSQLEELVNKGNKTAKKALKMKNNVNEYLSTIQVAITLANLLTGAYTEPLVTELLMKVGINIPEHVVIIISMIILTYIEVVFTELVPKNVSIMFPVKNLLLMTSILGFCHSLFYPLVWLMNISASSVLKMFKIDSEELKEDAYSIKELEIVSSKANKDGVLGDTSYQFTKNSLAIGDKTVGDIMLTEITWLTMNDLKNRNQLLSIIAETQYSRYPIKVDDKYKYLFVPNIILGDLTLQDINIFDIDTPLIDAFKELKKDHSHISLIREHGNIVGLLTLEDILEQIVGDIEDEND